MSHSSQRFPTIHPDVLRDIPLRRDEIAIQLEAVNLELQALRKMLTPPNSVILTGPEVDRVFSKLNALNGITS